MVKLTSKIKAFTLVESMVALVIVMIVFGMSSIVIVNITNNGMSKEKQNAFMLAKSIRNDSFLNQRYIDETIDLEELTLEKTILDYANSNHLKVMLIVVSKNKKKLFESRDLIVIDGAL